MNATPANHPRQRAIDGEEKHARRRAILDAAERLYDRAQALPNVAEVADEVGLAKGTMYLYFTSKEAIYLALHERHAQQFFVALNERLNQPTAFEFDAMAALVDKYMISHKSFLPLCNACMSAPAERVEMAIHEAFHTHLALWMGQAGAGLERHVPSLRPGDGLRLLHHGYALVLGLHQLLGAIPDSPVAPARCDMAGVGSFRDESMAALRRYWQAAVESGLLPIETAVQPNQTTLSTATRHAAAHPPSPPKHLRLKKGLPKPARRRPSKLANKRT